MASREALDKFMDDVLAWRLGEVVNATVASPAGDLIDRGLTLRRLLEEHGFELRVHGATRRKSAVELAQLEQTLTERATRQKLEAAAGQLAVALEDAASGLRYIRKRYGDLDGVGFDRVEAAADAALRAAGRLP